MRELESWEVTVKVANNYNINENGVVMNPDVAVLIEDPKNSYRRILIRYAKLGKFYYTSEDFAIMGQGFGGPVWEAYKGYPTLQHAVNHSVEWIAKRMERIVNEGVNCACSKSDLDWVKKHIPILREHYKDVNDFSSYIYTL